ncbi:MAG TPA: TetR/AcrR family transcriptional regulator C-terminal domain-containing protein [Candidatus Limnocylindrales bacterium]|nr:TetR/AcrR family transcriptional regulator C-terminal domain-containing protein [Candidatus Limnocylindrales bacterium]
MASQTRPREETRVALSRERVLEAAVALADEAGIGALTMRRLALELGVEAMTLYYYVARKDDILNGIVDIVLGEIELPSPGADWKPALRQMGISAYEVLVRHPWAASLVLSSSGISQARLRYMESILGTLRRAGFSAEMTDHGYHALESHIMGFTLWEVGMALGSAEELAGKATAFLRVLEREQLPYIAEHVDQHLKPRRPDDEGEFAFGLDLILDGLERMRATR